MEQPSKALPPIPSNLADAKSFFDSYKALNDLAVDRTIKLFDTVVAKALLPLFTAILGYIFGSRAESTGRA